MHLSKMKSHAGQKRSRHTSPHAKCWYKTTIASRRSVIGRYAARVFVLLHKSGLRPQKRAYFLGERETGNSSISFYWSLSFKKIPDRFLPYFYFGWESTVVCVPGFIYLGKYFLGWHNEPRVQRTFPCQIRTPENPKIRKVGSHVHTYIHGTFLRPEVCSLIVADELLRERVEEWCSI